MSKVRRSTGVAVMMAFVLSVATQCLAGQEATTARMACGAAAGHDCGGAAAAEDCCRIERAEQKQLVKQTQRIVPPLELVTSTIPALIRPLDTSFSSAFHVDSSLLKSVSPPKYVLLGSYLI